MVQSQLIDPDQSDLIDCYLILEVLHSDTNADHPNKCQFVAKRLEVVGKVADMNKWYQLRLSK